MSVTDIIDRLESENEKLQKKINRLMEKIEKLKCRKGEEETKPSGILFKKRSGRNYENYNS